MSKRLHTPEQIMQNKTISDDEEDSNNCLVRKMTPMPLSFDISDDDDFELPDLKPVVSKQSTLVINSQPVSRSNTSNVHPNSLFSTSPVNMDVDSMSDSE